jgi:DNA polymerase-4
MEALCRDCLTPFDHDPGPRCPACRRPRILAHPELRNLTIAHMDCDAFYASVEKRDDPSLTDQPLIVGGGKRGVVSTCCYIARIAGVRSAMPMFKALKLCPSAQVVRPRMEVYAAVSRQIREAMNALTPLIEPLSLDEAFLDLSGTQRLLGAPPAVSMARLAQTIERDIGITVSVGLSHCKYLAKVASDLDKPRGFSVIGRAETLEFLAPRPVRSIWGVGAALAKRLEGDGIHLIADLRPLGPERLVARYGSIGQRLTSCPSASTPAASTPASPPKASPPRQPSTPT